MGVTPNDLQNSMNSVKESILHRGVTLKSGLTPTKYKLVSYPTTGGGEYVYADNTKIETLESIYIIVSIDSGNSINISKGFEIIDIDNFSSKGFKDGDILYVGTNGEITNTIPTAAGSYVKEIGMVEEDDVVFNPSHYYLHLQ